MVVFSRKLVPCKSQTQRLPIIMVAKAINNDIVSSPTLSDIEVALTEADLLNLNCDGITAGDRMKRAEAAAKRIADKLVELEDKHIDDSNVKQTVSGAEKVISVASHSIDDNLRIIEGKLFGKGAGSVSSMLKDMIDQLADDLDDFDLLMKRYKEMTSQNYESLIGKNLTYSDYMNALGRKPDKVDAFYVYLVSCTESALEDDDVRTAKQQGIDDDTLFNMTKNLVKPPVVFRVHGAMATAAQESFVQNDELDKLIGEILPAFADEIFERDDKDGLFGAFCDIYDELT